MFESIDAAMASFAKLNNPPRIAHDRERAVNALIRIESGYMLKRDPDNGNTQADRRGRADAATAAERRLEGPGRR